MNKKPSQSYEDRLRHHIRLQLALPCASCGMTPRISLLAKFLQINPTALWRFVKVRRTRMLRRNMAKLAGWLRMRGVEIPDPPKHEDPPAESE